MAFTVSAQQYHFFAENATTTTPITAPYQLITTPNRRQVQFFTRFLSMEGFSGSQDQGKPLDDEKEKNNTQTFLNESLYHQAIFTINSSIESIILSRLEPRVVYDVNLTRSDLETEATLTKIQPPALAQPSSNTSHHIESCNLIVPTFGYPSLLIGAQAPMPTPLLTTNASAVPVSPHPPSPHLERSSPTFLSQDLPLSAPSLYGFVPNSDRVTLEDTGLQPLTEEEEGKLWPEFSSPLNQSQDSASSTHSPKWVHHSHHKSSFGTSNEGRIGEALGQSESRQGKKDKHEKNDRNHGNAKKVFSLPISAQSLPHYRFERVSPSLVNQSDSISGFKTATGQRSGLGGGKSFSVCGGNPNNQKTSKLAHFGINQQPLEFDPKSLSYKLYQQQSSLFRPVWKQTTPISLPTADSSKINTNENRLEHDSSFFLMDVDLLFVPSVAKLSQISELPCETVATLESDSTGEDDDDGDHHEDYGRMSRNFDSCQDENDHFYSNLGPLTQDRNIQPNPTMTPDVTDHTLSSVQDKRRVPLYKFRPKSKKMCRDPFQITLSALLLTNILMFGIFLGLSYRHGATALGNDLSPDIDSRNVALQEEVDPTEQNSHFARIPVLHPKADSSFFSQPNPPILGHYHPYQEIMANPPSFSLPLNPMAFWAPISTGSPSPSSSASASFLPSSFSPTQEKPHPSFSKMPTLLKMPELMEKRLGDKVAPHFVLTLPVPPNPVFPSPSASPPHSLPLGSNPNPTSSSHLIQTHSNSVLSPSTDSHNSEYQCSSNDRLPEPSTRTKISAVAILAKHPFMVVGVASFSLISILAIVALSFIGLSMNPPGHPIRRRFK